MKNIARLLLSGLLLLSSYPLFARYEWSVPVTISNSDQNGEPTIVIDNNNVIHAFWNELGYLKDQKVRIEGDEKVSDYSVIKHCYSTDSGITWSTPLNITPANTYYWFHNVQAVVDSQNNIHICFNCIDTGSFFYMKNVEGVWSEPQFLDVYITAMPRMVIDSTDRLYLFYMIYDKEYYFYKEKNADWTSMYEVPDYYYCIEFAVDSNDNIYGVGGDSNPYTDEKACLLKYEKVTSEWTDIIDLSPGCNGAISRADNLHLEVDGTLHVVIDDGIDERYDRTLYRKGNISDLTTWSQAELVNENGSPWWKNIFVDQNKNPNILESGTNVNEIEQKTKFNSIWSSSLFVAEISTVINDFEIIFKDNTVSLVYWTSEFDSDSTICKIYFIKKEIETGIEGNINNITDYCLFQNYPNPFNNETKIKFSLNETANIELIVFNSKGEQVELLNDGSMNKGTHGINFNATKLNSGVYYYQLVMNGVVKETKKMLYLR